VLPERLRAMQERVVNYKRLIVVGHWMAYSEAGHWAENGVVGNNGLAYQQTQRKAEPQSWTDVPVGAPGTCCSKRRYRGVPRQICRRFPLVGGLRANRK
jgi:hypothetical protein